MSKPIVAIVGRPNVGKSTLFNILAGENISIVKDTPGVTRDRIYADVEWLGKNFTMIDTGGIEPDSSDIILSQMREQAQIAIDTADVIIFMTDVRQGLVDADARVADMLRRAKKPVILVVNKVDSFQKFMADTYEFYNLGIGDPIPISASSKLGIGDMLDEVIRHFPEHDTEEEEDDRPRIAVVGKPNVGKSSIINRLLGENRCIVSDIAGTTRDAIDTAVTWNGKEYVFIDTAGLRRKSKIKEELERYSIIRTVTAVERADVVVMVIDAVEGITEQDAKIAGIATLYGNDIFYQYYNANEGMYVYKAGIDGKDDKKFSSKVYNLASVYNGKFYFADTYNKNYISTLDASTGNVSAYFNVNAYLVDAADNYIYYIDLDKGYALMRLNTSNKTLEQLYSPADGGKVINYNRYGNKIFFQVEGTNTGLYRMNADGTQIEYIAAGNVSTINCTSQYTFFQYYEDNETLYRIPTVNPITKVEEITIKTGK